MIIKPGRWPPPIPREPTDATAGTTVWWQALDGKAEDDPLLVPFEWQGAEAPEFFHRQVERLSPFQKIFSTMSGARKASGRCRLISLRSQFPRAAISVIEVAAPLAN